MPSPQLYPLSLHDALPIYPFQSIVVRSVELVYACDESLRLIAAYDEPDAHAVPVSPRAGTGYGASEAPRGLLLHRYRLDADGTDRKSTRLNSSHSSISYAVSPALPSFPTRRSSDLPVPEHRRPERRARLRLRRIAASDRGVRRARCACRSGLAACRHGVRRQRGSARTAPPPIPARRGRHRSEEHTSELQSQFHLVCRLPSSTLFPYTTLFRSTRSRASSSGASSSSTPATNRCV